MELIEPTFILFFDNHLSFFDMQIKDLFLI